MSPQPYKLPDRTESPPDVFISYARRDFDKVRRIIDEFTALDLRFWLDQNNIEGGENFGAAIARNVKLSRVFVLMCSDAALRSRNVTKEINLAWKYERPVLPLLLEPVSFPEQVEFFLEGVQWIEILDRPAQQWLPRVQRALTKAGVVNTKSTQSAATSADPEAPTVRPSQTRGDLTSLRLLASFTDRIWPIAPDRIPAGRQSPAVFRGLGAPQKDAQRAYKIGSHLGLAIDSERAGRLLLIDEGNDGIIYCLCPSWFAPDTRIDKGMNYLPQANTRYQSFQLSGEPGREQLLAIITDEPLALDWLPADPGTPARVLNTQDLELLTTQLRQLNPTSWLALATYFDVVP